VGSAIIVGLKALAQNWRPLLVIGALLGALAVPIGLLFVSFYLSALSGGTASPILAFLILLLGPMFQLLLFGTQYLAFRDIFALDSNTGADEHAKADQLVA
jgi:sulfite exporter TauE/SafE